MGEHLVSKDGGRSFSNEDGFSLFAERVPAWWEALHAAVSIDDGKWHTAAVTLFADDKATLYVDGVVHGSIRNDESLLAFLPEVLVGRLSDKITCHSILACPDQG